MWRGPIWDAGDSADWHRLPVFSVYLYAWPVTYQSNMHIGATLKLDFTAVKMCVKYVLEALVLVLLYKEAWNVNYGMSYGIRY